MVAVTFDDGPKDYPSTYTLDALRKIGARGTYFIVGKQLERYGYVLQKQYDQNHIFGTHTFHHWGGGSFKSDESRLKELALSAEWTLPLVGEEASLFRAPGGTYPSWVESGMPMPIIQWSVDTYDYTGKSPKRIFYTFRDKVTEGDIILCHDTGEYLHESVPLWGEYLLERGFMFVTVDELACAYGLEMQPSVVYWSVRPGESSVDGQVTEKSGFPPKWGGKPLFDGSVWRSGPTRRGVDRLDQLIGQPHLPDDAVRIQRDTAGLFPAVHADDRAAHAGEQAVRDLDPVARLHDLHMADVPFLLPHPLGKGQVRARQIIPPAFPVAQRTDHAGNVHQFTGGTSSGRYTNT